MEVFKFIALSGSLVSAASPNNHSYSNILSIPQAEWVALNNTVGGRLQGVRPFEIACFSRFENRPLTPSPFNCNAVQAGYASPTFRSPHFNAYMMPHWETCQTSHQGCLLDDTNPKNPAAFNISNDCSQGSISPFYIDVRTERDVQSAFAFSARTGVPLSIKNSGHDYKGRSSSRGSLSLWTFNMKSMSYNKQFVPQGCNVSYNAVTVGAGASWQDVYAFADAHNLTIVGGYHQTVGASGGWLMGGGHSILSPALGLGVDRVVEIKIVTPDGQSRVANDCHNSDLFWALRGGGGGTFGVVLDLESTHKVEPQLSLQVASLSFNGTSTNLRQFYGLAINNSVKWGSEGWGGHIQGTALIYVTPNLSLDEARESMKPMSNFILSQNGTIVLETLTWYPFFLKYVVAAEAAVGSLTILGSRLVPKANFDTDSGKLQLLDFMMSLVPQSLPYVPVVPPVNFNFTEGSTSVTPAWRSALWHFGFHTSWEFNSSISDIQTQYAMVHNVTKTLRELTPGSGSYFNEGDVYELDHENTFWGPNYSQLLKIKRKYDPQSLLDCWQCVGWKGSDDARYCTRQVLRIVRGHRGSKPIPKWPFVLGHRDGAT
ncbi:FAD-binding domain-containing protein [Rickenella mellea]|uniref:FAD-binding domain-containing protein n=1 Tax=Rickenella mellea TaxID=50990 RepID=A0A4Y7QH26_9AGAM|nr:FAD-binding domain-containing protein [Rickenella mellea]